MERSNTRVPEPVLRAEARGHSVYDDPPSGISAASRWTCSACGSAVLSYNGNIYGSALLIDCSVVKP